MEKIKVQNNQGWNFDNSYLSLPKDLYSRMQPVAVPEPELVVVNRALASDLGLNLDDASETTMAQLFSGNQLPDGAEPLAQAYAGHQFGRFTLLGDGRAHLLGEHLTTDGRRVDVQLKGSGKTPYGRRGDGRAALGPMLREYIISEAMHGLGIPTTRSLAVVTTGEKIVRNTEETGAILTRIADSHIRIGTFEYLAAHREIESLKNLADYTIRRHYPEIESSDSPYQDLLIAVMKKQISLIVEWLRVGFIHGVMNTDNVAISGETIDYGPCAFMDAYNPQTVFSSIDHQGRYAYANQPFITLWNLNRFAETLIFLIDKDLEKGAEIVEEKLQIFESLFGESWLAMMRRKLGLPGLENEDEALISDLLIWMQSAEADFTNTFRALLSETLPEGALYQSEQFQRWWQRWKKRTERNGGSYQDSYAMMETVNPAVIPRNHLVQNALSNAEQGDYTSFHNLNRVLAEPYKQRNEGDAYTLPPQPEERVYQTFCGT